MSFGGNDGGITLYVQEGKLCFLYNYVAVNYTTSSPNDKSRTGHHFLSIEFAPTGKPDFTQGKGAPGTVTLFVDGKEVGRGDIAELHRIDWHKAVRCCRSRRQVPRINPEYKAPFSFTGTIKRVIVDISGEHVEDHETAMRVFLAKQ